MAEVVCVAGRNGREYLRSWVGCFGGGGFPIVWDFEAPRRVGTRNGRIGKVQFGIVRFM